MTTNPIAYSFFFENGDCVTYCLECGEQAVKDFGRESDAQLTYLNGDTMDCESCGNIIKDVN